MSELTTANLLITFHNGKPTAAARVESREDTPESTQQALGRACRDLEGLFESVLSEVFS